MSIRKIKRREASTRNAIVGLFLLALVAVAVFGGCGDKEKIEDGKPKTEAAAEGTVEVKANTDAQSEQIVQKDGTIEYNEKSYKVIEVDGGDISGSRQPNVAVDIGFGNRTYWAFTNENGQLIKVIASKIILQDDSAEPVNSKGRYYNDEAKVPGTERSDMDEGHVIADSLGGVSNAYNITPQNSTMNRHGDQAYMEKVIRDSGGCENFIATITYTDSTTQIPSHYHYEYVLNGETVVDDFDNINPDEANAVLNQQKTEDTSKMNSNSTRTVQPRDLDSVDTNGDGKVTIKEAKEAGYSIPIHSDSWLYPYMDDRDGDGMVGE